MKTIILGFLLKNVLKIFKYVFDLLFKNDFFFMSTKNNS